MNNYNAVLARNTANAPQDLGIHSQSVTFSHYNNISAQLPVDPKNGKLVTGGINQQAERCFENIKAILESINHVMDDVVRITVFIKNISDISAVDTVDLQTNQPKSYVFFVKVNMLYKKIVE